MDRSVRSVRAMDATMLDRLNSATKYPSIPTYHALDPKGRGRLTETLEVEFPEGVNVEAYEKIDGTNCRLIFPPDGDYPLIGSRTELLTFLSDVIHNPSQGIVSAARDTAARLHETGDLADTGAWTVVYGEVYGGKIGAHAKDYAGDGVATGFRVFDIASFESDVLDRDREDIAAWRDNGGQAFWDSFDRREATTELKLKAVPLAGFFGSLPTSLEDTWRWLQAVSTKSLAALDDNARRMSEGVVVRTSDRTRIAKIRHEDYRRTLGTGR